MNKPMTMQQQQKYLANFLFTYRTTPTTTTGRSPAEMILNYQPRILIQLVGPPKVSPQRSVPRTMPSQYMVGQKVLVKTGKSGPKTPGRISKRVGTNTYLVTLDNSQLRLAHTHQLTASHLAEALHPSLFESGMDPGKPRATDEVRSPGGKDQATSTVTNSGSPNTAQTSPRGEEANSPI
jgi:hypothetical protein